MINGKKVSLIFPAYNEEKNIGQAIDDFKKLGFIDEIIVVDNNSSDNTAKISLKKQVKVVAEKKQGYGYALLKGMSVAAGEYIFLCEPDGTFRAKDAKKLLKYIDAYEVIIGTRTNKKFISKFANMYGLLRWGNIILAKIIQLLYRPRCILSDCGCTFRVMKREVVKEILPQVTVGGSHFLSELLVLTLKTKYKVIETPLHYEQRIGESKITGSLKRSIRVGLSMFKTVIKYKFQTHVSYNKKFLFFLSIFTLCFCLAIAVNLSPFLRGPAPYPPNWRWAYQPTPLSFKLFVPLFLMLVIMWTVYYFDKMKKPKTTLLITILLLGGFLLQISLLFASRAGIAVLLHRIISPTINGYFTVSLQKQSLPLFLKNFTANMGSYPMYAKFHPPGAVLFFSFLNACASILNFLFPVIAKLTPKHSDVAIIWNGLNDAQKVSALLSGFIIAFLSYVTLIPLYLSGKILYGQQTAKRSIFLFLFIPNILLFVPLNDVFLPLFTVWSLYYFLISTEKQNIFFSFLSGIVLFVGTFFSLTFLPLLLFFFIFLILQKKIRKSVNLFLSFLIGFIIMPLLLLVLYHVDFISLTQQMMQFHETAQTGRNYWVWLFYNVYDFFIFVGIPLSTLFFYQIIKKNRDKLFLSFLIMFIFLELSGSVRGETGRIWLPFVPLVILPVANFITNSLKFSSKQLILILLLQAIQVIVFETFLITLW